VYLVTIYNEDLKDVENKGVRIKILDRAQELFRSDLNVIAYDGETTLFTVHELKKIWFEVVLDQTNAANKYTVNIDNTTLEKISLKATKENNEAIKFLNIILRQIPTK
jgi:hypothetical protein